MSLSTCGFFQEDHYEKQLLLLLCLYWIAHCRSHSTIPGSNTDIISMQETLNYWKQLSHVMKYFRPEEDPGARLPRNFVSGFLEGRN